MHSVSLISGMVVCSNPMPELDFEESIQAVEEGNAKIRAPKTQSNQSVYTQMCWFALQSLY